VAAGAVAQLVLDQYQIQIQSYTIALGGIKSRIFDARAIEKNPFKCPDMAAAREMEKKIETVKRQGDSLGGIVEIKAVNVPAGIGDPVFDKLDGDIAKAMMSIGAVKAVEIGAGILAPEMTGFENNDALTRQGFVSNHSGGILAGISNGDEIVVRVHVKPIPSIRKPQKTVTDQGVPTMISTKGRHDICAIPRINRVCESMLALVLTDHVLRQKTIESDFIAIFE
jgi:chorismate synthase